MMKKKWCKLAALALTCGSLLAAVAAVTRKKPLRAARKFQAMSWSIRPCILMSSIPV